MKNILTRVGWPVLFPGRGRNLFALVWTYRNPKIFEIGEEEREIIAFIFAHICLKRVLK
jgi:hypothetical protein